MIACSHCHEISHGDGRCDVCGGDLGDGMLVPALEDGYTLDDGPPLGQGSFASVHAATSLIDGSRCAVKLVDLRRATTSARIRKQLRASFLREASTLTVLQHPHIVGVQAFGARDPDTLFMAMELIPGGQTLQRVLNKASVRGKKPGINTILRVLEEVGAALEYLHTRKLVHRDLKPANIGVDAHRRFKLLDFGLVKLVDDGFGASHDAVTVAGWGSYNYGAPEQFLQGNIGPWTDIYSLGAVAYELIAGRPPIDNGNLERILASMSRAAEPLPEDRQRPLALSDLVMRMIEKCPSDRPQSMSEVLADVRLVRKGLKQAAAAAEPPSDSLEVQASPTPAPRVMVIRSRRGDETRPADPRALELINATRAGAEPAPLSELVAETPVSTRPPGPEEHVVSPFMPVPPRPLSIAAAGVACVVIGLFGLWITLGGV